MFKMGLQRSLRDEEVVLEGQDLGRERRGIWPRDGNRVTA